jgi:hypothetical protein
MMDDLLKGRTDRQSIESIAVFLPFFASRLSMPNPEEGPMGPP